MEDIADKCYKEKGLDVLPCLKRVWIDLCKSYMVEARWYYESYTPTLDEYLENAWVSIAGICLLIVSCCLSQDFTADSFNDLGFYPDSVRFSSMLFRFYNDLATTTAEIKRGDVSKSIICYMKEKNVSEAVAREGIASLIRKYWKKLNRERIAASKFNVSFGKTLMDLPRTAHFFYQCGDGYGMQHKENRDTVISLLLEPILI